MKMTIAEMKNTLKEISRLVSTEQISDLKEKIVGVTQQNQKKKKVFQKIG